MFGVGLEEFIAIIMVALIVLGPERLPIAMRTVGRWVRQLRDMSRNSAVNLPKSSPLSKRR